MPESSGQVSRAAGLLRVEALFLYSSRCLRQVSRLLLDTWSAVARAHRHLYVCYTTAASRESKLLAALWSRAFILRGDVASGSYETKRSLRSYVSCALAHWSRHSARAPQWSLALEELAFASVLPLGVIALGGLIRRGTTCFAVQTTPLRLRSPDFRQRMCDKGGGNNPVLLRRCAIICGTEALNSGLT